MPISANPDTGEAFYLDSSGQWQNARVAVNPGTREMFAFDPESKTWEKVGTQGHGILGFVDDAVRALASGMTFGFADEIAAKANELTGHGTYEQNVAQERARDASIPTAIKLPGEIAGGVASTVATAPITGAISAATGAAKLPGIVRAALGGAAAGGAYGAGNASDGLQNRLIGAAEGAGVGLVAGGALGVAGNVASHVVNPQGRATAEIARAMGRDSLTPGAAVTAAAASGRPGVATLADVGGENVRGLMERVAQTPGAGRSIVVPELTARQTGQIDRLASDLSELAGTKKSAFEAVTDTIAERAAQSKPLYDMAFNFNARMDADIVKAWDTATATGYGKQILNSSTLRRTLQSEYGITDTSVAPLMVQIDAWKNVASDAIGAAIRKGSNNEARVIGNVRDSVLDIVKQKNPAYEKALETWAGKSAYLDAIDEGKNILGSKVGAEELAAKFAKLGASEKEAFRIGAISAIRSRMGNDPAQLADFTKYVRAPEVRAKIAAIMPNKVAAAKWSQRLGFEIKSSELTNRALRNSATARRLAESQDAKSIVNDLAADAFMGTPGVSLARKLVAGSLGRVRDTIRSRTDAEIARRLTAPVGQIQKTVGK